MGDTTTIKSSIEEPLAAQITNRQYKDTLFRALFTDKKRFIELYNAITNEHYPEDIEITPCPTNPLMAMFNDLAFIIESKLIVMCEHQSTENPNMPLRFLFYISDVLRTHTIKIDSLYRKSLVQIPTPEFYVLYNGKPKIKNPNMYLSDAFLKKDRNNSLELSAKIININYENGDDALKQSATLGGYSLLISETEKNITAGLSRDEAIKRAIEACIEKNILFDFLTEKYTEVVDMLTFEYDQEAERRALRLDGKEEGIQEGMQKGKQEGKQEGKRDIIIQMMQNGKSLEELSEFIGISKTELQQLIN